ncbi:MAG: circadian clock KaiB family protein [Chroococcidiopsidaceae cyanobacterium CP_BM_ER_R8_30]|nr:circadian clock KaiB family protein [Chroococcidiopsidaceae cyanobacterium CP_BM_ER_R8_30]
MKWLSFYEVGADETIRNLQFSRYNPKLVLPKLFKGIALFTPSGDLIYCIDSSKRDRWHLELCVGLQEILGLPEPPHFLVPCYTATLDRYLDRRTQKVRTLAEAYPLVLRHQALLNTVFETGDLVWQASPWLEGVCDPMVLATYRSSFPQLWEDRNLIIRFEHSEPMSSSQQSVVFPLLEQPKMQGYVFRLFVAGHSIATERILQNLHQLLEQSLLYPYTLKVIDVFKHPEQAEANQVSATPALVRVWPQPIRRLVGNLDNAEKILAMLSSSSTDLKP